MFIHHPDKDRDERVVSQHRQPGDGVRGQTGYHFNQEVDSGNIRLCLGVCVCGGSVRSGEWEVGSGEWGVGSGSGEWIHDLKTSLKLIHAHVCITVFK